MHQTHSTAACGHVYFGICVFLSVVLVPISTTWATCPLQVGSLECVFDGPSTLGSEEVPAPVFPALYSHSDALMQVTQCNFVNSIYTHFHYCLQLSMHIGDERSGERFIGGLVVVSFASTRWQRSHSVRWFGVGTFLLSFIWNIILTLLASETNRPKCIIGSVLCHGEMSMDHSITRCYFKRNILLMAYLKISFFLNNWTL